ncbi:MAG: undecaprenyl diphosphate synthase family protein [Stellaceae bacterium]
MFTRTLWPDFGKNDLEQAIEDYCGRDRRYGAAFGAL